ncbi:hypothetical protein AAAT69_20860, partial [Phocaeicola vulgatus]|uniref:hypothetical protein n=1 Tax=Phocaeicola vulgatus TaxID=821 RepID=UPI0032C0D6DF
WMELFSIRIQRTFQLVSTDELYTLERNHISKVKFLSFEIFFKHCPFLDGLNPIAIKGIAISLQALINISLGFISCSFQVDNM